MTDSVGLLGGTGCGGGGPAPAGTAISSVAGDDGAGGTAGTGDRTRATGRPAVAATADRAGVTTGAAHAPGGGRVGADPTGTTVAGRPRVSAGTTGGSGSRQSIGAIADQRTPQQRVGGRVDHRQHLLLRGLQRRSIGRFGGRVGAARSGQGPQKLVVKRRRLGTDRLVSLAMAGKQRRNRDRHLIIGSGHHPGRRPHGRGVGRADR